MTDNNKAVRGPTAGRFIVLRVWMCCCGVDLRCLHISKKMWLDDAYIYIIYGRGSSDRMYSSWL
jgi:hypothetical protein